MLYLFLRRLLFVIPILFLVSILVFSFVLLIPGDPAVTLAGDNPTPEQIAQIRDKLGLDDPILTQYGHWVSHIVRGDLGDSLFTGRPVWKSIKERLPVTISLAGLSLLFALIIAIPAGIIAATNRGRWIDSLTTVGASLGLAMPSFWLGLILVLIFGLKLGWLPATGFTAISDSPWEWFKHLVLPAVTLGAAAAAETTRQLRVSLSDVLDEDYVRTAKAKGLGWRAVVFKHGMKNAAIPVITVIGFQVAFLLGGSVIVEQLFALPGLGGLAIRAVLDRDVPVIQGIVMFAATIVIVVNLIVDMLYGFLNPKVRAVSAVGGGFDREMDFQDPWTGFTGWGDTAADDVKGESATRRFVRRFAGHKVAVGALVFIVALILVAIFASSIAPFDPNKQSLADHLNGPSHAHWLGTDELGRDVLTRLIYGSRVSLTAALQAVVIAVVLGVPPGLLAGYFGSWIDMVISRLTDAVMSFPPLLLAIGIVGVFGAGLRNAMLAVGIIFAPRFLRLTRSAVLAVRQETYIEASKSIGSSTGRILRTRILPNILSPLVVQISLSLGFAMLAEAGLSFLGLGVQPPQASWGAMVGRAYRYLDEAPTLVIFPGVAIVLAVLAFNLLGDGLRDSFGRETRKGA